VRTIEESVRAITEPVRRFWDFLQDVRVELSKVHWPSRKETQATTRVVVIVVFAVAAYLGAVDWVLSRFVQLLLGTGGG
jgi:preprotein translocase subunit SecE